MSFALNLPKLSFAGPGAVVDAIEELAKQKTNRVLLVTDSNLIKLGILNDVFAQFELHNISYALFDQVTPNPTASLVRQGYQVYLDHECDAFMAVGGGSPMDCAKAIRVMASNPGRDICDFNGVGQVTHPGQFFVAVNTTAGTAAEMTSNSVITDEKKQVKMVIIDAKQIPDIAVNDANLMLDLPANVTAATGMDALTHAIEAYVTPGAHTLTEPTAREAIKLIRQWLPIAVADGKNVEARDKLACAQFLAGMAFNSSGLGLVHAMAHQPGATHNLPHGVCNAILLPYVCEYNAKYVPERYKLVAEALLDQKLDMNDVQGAEKAIELIKELSSQVKIPNGFSDLGIQSSDIRVWVGKAMVDPCLPGNPHLPTAEEVESIYELAM
ncbi:lactaldehyde reductase [Agarivorans sp. TSD2052]|uniref:lactaldehyde reductase n=1 Tax=Agarivorans sp. TSD2052 TaxID=2937286 RepID=UPI00200EA2F4|nr:lactaldehyde reductase [Agarivorans sp. TSD2052]UPW18804.1 lactaldehyde reductase [Agarivorans sp. TSD2052]